jgi:hypothetical protein
MEQHGFHMTDGMTISLEPSGSQKQAIHQRTDLSGICKNNFLSTAGAVSGSAFLKAGAIGTAAEGR